MKFICKTILISIIMYALFCITKPHIIIVILNKIWRIIFEFLLDLFIKYYIL